jgi:hypothetical protein
VLVMLIPVYIAQRLAGGDTEARATTGGVGAATD